MIVLKRIKALALAALVGFTAVTPTIITAADVYEPDFIKACQTLNTADIERLSLLPEEEVDDDKQAVIEELYKAQDILKMIESCSLSLDTTTLAAANERIQEIESSLIKSTLNKERRKVSDCYALIVDIQKNPKADWQSKVEALANYDLQKLATYYWHLSNGEDLDGLAVKESAKQNPTANQSTVSQDEKGSTDNNYGVGVQDWSSSSPNKTEQADTAVTQRPAASDATKGTADTGADKSQDTKSTSASDAQSSLVVEKSSEGLTGETPYFFNANEDRSGYPNETAYKVEHYLVGTVSWHDVSYNHWARDAFQQLSRAGIMKGLADHTMQPNAKLKVSDALTVICRAIHSKEIMTFKSLPPIKVQRAYIDKIVKDNSHWAYYYVGDVLSRLNPNTINSILQGRTGSMAFNKEMTREEVAAVLYAMFGDNQAHTFSLEYGDADKVSFTSAMAWCENNGIICGDNNNRLNPQGTVTRAELATILARILND